MSLPPWREAPISRDQDRKGFDCGDADLNRFLRDHARQNHEQGASKTFVALGEDERTILGFYSLSPVSVTYASAPAEVTRGLPRYDVPMFRLGRLAVDRAYQGKGLLGGQLLLCAGRRCLRVAEDVGGVALLIDAKSERVARWYMSFGAVALEDLPLTLVLPLATMRQALEV